MQILPENKPPYYVCIDHVQPLSIRGLIEHITGSFVYITFEKVSQDIEALRSLGIELKNTYFKISELKIAICDCSSLLQLIYQAIGLSEGLSRFADNTVLGQEYCKFLTLKSKIIAANEYKEICSTAFEFRLYGSGDSKLREARQQLESTKWLLQEPQNQLQRFTTGQIYYSPNLYFTPTYVPYNQRYGFGNQNVGLNETGKSLNQDNQIKIELLEEINTSFINKGEANEKQVDILKNQLQVVQRRLSWGNTKISNQKREITNLLRKNSQIKNFNGSLFKSVKSVNKISCVRKIIPFDENSKEHSEYFNAIDAKDKMDSHSEADLLSSASSENSP